MNADGIFIVVPQDEIWNLIAGYIWDEETKIANLTIRDETGTGQIRMSYSSSGTQIWWESPSGQIFMLPGWQIFLGLAVGVANDVNGHLLVRRIPYTGDK